MTVQATTLNGRPGQTANDYKTKELIVYLAKKSEEDSTWGRTKLNKLLFFIDFGYYVFYGRSITGQQYERKEYGPCPTHISTFREELIADGSLKPQTRIAGIRRQFALKAERLPDLSAFDKHELTYVDKIVNKWRAMGAAQMSDKSHEFVGWQIIEPDEPIPYGLALIDQHRDEPKPREVEYAKMLAKIPLEERRKVST